MRLQPNKLATNTTEKDWMKRLTWALPLFFLAKGLIWLSLPLFLALYGLD